MRTSLPSLAALALVGGAIVASGCAEHVPTGSNACPCATGYVCCGSGVCALDEAGCGTATAALSVAAQGQWVGYLENFSGLPSGSDRVEIDLTVGADGQLQGRFVIGEGTPSEEVPVAGQPWPGSFDIYNHPWIAGFPMDGFSYTARDIRWQARRLKFEGHYAEPWGPWCALQTPNLATLDPYGGYLCGPEATGYAEEGGPGTHQCFVGPSRTPIDCYFLYLCSSAMGKGACLCTDTACVAGAPLSPGWTIRFDLDVQGDEAEGSLALTRINNDGSDRTSNVRLIRASR